MTNVSKCVVFIATPLEPIHVDRVRSVAPDRVEVVYEPDWLPPTRYVADHKGVDGFTLTAEQDVKWREQLARAEVLFDFPPSALDGTRGLEIARQLKWIQTTSSGVGQAIKRFGLRDSDILITTARGVHAGPLTEFVFLSLLSYVKRLAHLQSEQRAKRWERFCGDELEGKTLAVVGMGGVGRRVAATARCFGMRVLAISRPGSSKTTEELGVDVLYPPEDLHRMLAETDALVLSVPHTSETENMIDGQALAALRPGALFVNVARGQVVDETALTEALRTGRIAFAGLDVFATEPLPSDSPLWELDNVLVSPHSSSTATGENRRITDIFCHNLSLYLDGRLDEMRNVFDKTRLY